jgi:arylsulfatase A-like enzyme
MKDTRRHAAAALALALILLPACSRGGRPNVLLVVIDTVRADHVHCYGYERQTTPCLDSLAASGTMYASCQAQSSWTLPAFASIFTGISPRAHGAGWRDGLFFGLDGRLSTLPVFMNDNGYATSGFFNVIFLSEDFGFHRGFDHFDCQGFANRGSTRRADGTAGDFLAWLDGNGDTPFFAVVHFYDPHMRYDPPSPWSDMFTDGGYTGPYDSSWGGVEQLIAVNSGADTIPPDGLANLTALYDGEIAFADAGLDSLLSGLRRRGLSDRTVVIVMADHGEEFLEHGRIEHGASLFQETVHVPLVVSGPGVPAGRVDSTLCSQMDIFPTVASLCGLEPPRGMEGRPLLPEPPEGRSVPASGVLWAEGDQASVVEGTRKTVWHPIDGSAESYDLSTDPLEIEPLEPSDYELEGVLEYWGTPAAGRPPQVAFRETVDRALRDLGYIR